MGTHIFHVHLRNGDIISDCAVAENIKLARKQLREKYGNKVKSFELIKVE